MAYKHKNAKGTDYYLHNKKVKLRGSGKDQIIYFFAREVRVADALEDIPEGYEVKENTKTGLPILKRK